MNDSKNSSKGLLVLRVVHPLTQEQGQRMVKDLAPVAQALGVELLIADNGADVRLEYGSSALLERVCVALEEIAAQGRAPEVNMAEIAPQALNARAPGLNSRAHTPPVRTPPPFRNPGPDRG